MDQTRAALYQDYATWKTWDGDAASPSQVTRREEAFGIECARAGLSPGSRVLELGFGDGAFMAWCRAGGHAVSGIEVIATLVDRARAGGYDVVLSDGSPPGSLDGPFDLIAAFDVFEHLTAEELDAWLSWMRDRLAPTGRVLARFPNGGSPFGRLYQSGDLTHRSTLCASSIEQLAQRAGLRLVSATNAARPLAGGRSKWAKRLAYLGRDLTEAALGQIYYARRVPLDPNLTVVLARAGTS